ncbi:MAG: hypothetical protein KAX44_04730, partial [Candidatus Brocadiae bacterium]|nr:hypothetical protein [Candidatus Brocadiia bacterium]
VGAAPVDVGCNRRERQPDGSIKLGHNPGGPCLHEATVWRFARTGGDDVVLFSIPMHGTTLGQRNLSLSAEWMGRAVHFLETESPDMKVVFLQGCGGDQDPYYTVSEGRRGTFDELEQHGRDAATAVRTALEKMRELNPLPLRSVLWTTELPPKEDDGEPQSLPLHGVRVGDAVLVALGCEAFVEYALFGRATSPAKETLILGYSGGSVGYLPTADVYESGGYETRTSKVAPQSEQIVKEAMRRMFEELAR